MGVKTTGSSYYSLDNKNCLNVLGRQMSIFYLVKV